MLRYNWIAWGLLVELLALPLNGYAQEAAGTVPDSIQLAAIAVVARQNGSSTAGLMVLAADKVHYPYSAADVFKFRIYDERVKSLSAVTLDASKRVLDDAALDAAEDALLLNEYGRFEVALAETLALLPDDAPISVMLWLKESEYDRPARPNPHKTLSPEDVEQHYRTVDVSRSAFNEGTVAPVVAQLMGRGQTVEFDRYAPAVYVRTTAQVVREIARWPEIQQLYLSREYKPGLDIVRATLGVNTIQQFGTSLGTGVKIAEIETEGGLVAAGNPYLSGIVQDATSACASAHTTRVAGVLRSTHSTIRGIAPGVTLRVGGSCNSITSQLHSRSTAAADWGARAINLSWGADTQRLIGESDRFYDNMVITRDRTIITIAGNEGNADGDVRSPGLAYNVITVGNFWDQGTVSRSDDNIYFQSSFGDPISTNGDREKPEVAAPGTDISTTKQTSPWVGDVVTGTSFAAPVVSGLAALMFEQNSALAMWPEVFKAIVMATAIFDVDHLSGILSDKDGAGGIDGRRAYEMSNGSTTGEGWMGTAYTCSSPSQLDLAGPAGGQVSLVANKRTRVVIAWDNSPSWSSYANRPSANIDLLIFNPSGQLVASSVSLDNTYEIVEFTTAVTGNYTIRASRLSCSFSPHFLGWAWHQVNTQAWE